MELSSVLIIVGSGLGTAVGALGLLVFRRPSPRALDTALGFTGGVMLAAAVFSLLVPALERGSVWEVLAGFAVGSVFIVGLDHFVPHAHAYFAERGRLSAERAPESKRALLLLGALVIHNIPEGLAVGVAFAAGGPDLGIPLAIAIGLQNVPEGFAAGAPLVPAGVRTGQAVLVAGATGLVEPPAAFLAIGFFEFASGLLVPGLAFAAGAMIYVVADELIPESHSRGNEREATLGLLAGFAVMLGLDNAF